VSVSEKRITFLSQKRAYNVEIILQRLKSTVTHIRDTIITCDMTKLNPEMLSVISVYHCYYYSYYCYTTYYIIIIIILII
jgi:hypothetical protein